MRRSPISCILPPYILERIIENGTELQKAKARETHAETIQLRAQREEARVAPKAPPGDRAQAVGIQRMVFSADNQSTLPGRLVRAEGAPATGDAATDEAYDGAGATYNLYWQVYQRSSIDGNGMRIDSTVHYRQGYDNAFWNGSQMVYGDGDEDLPPDQRLFNRFTISIDVIGHELTHGVTQYTGNLIYSNQPGALNESFSDVFGSLVKQHSRGQTAGSADWLIGEGLLTANVNGQALRSMKAPGTAYDDPILGKDPQPAHMNDYVHTLNDNGGVHINSGIPNHAFYLAALELGGNAWEKAGQIWFVTLRDRIQSNTNFQSAANMTYTVAGTLYGANSLEQQAVKNGWAGVGINVELEDGGNQNPGCLAGLARLLGGR